MPITSTSPYTISFKSTVTIYQTEVRCHINENEFNLSQNPTMTRPCSSSLQDRVTGSYFQPYVTTVGLYNAADELLMVAKVGSPISMPTNTDITFLIRYDG